MRAYRASRRKGMLNKYSVNFILIGVNVVFFILSFVLLSQGERFVDFLALNPGNILQGKYVWTFLTSMFMHGGIFHLFANMLSLFFVGSLIERILGPKRYLGFYLAAGLFAGLLFVLSALIFPSALNAYAVGASGAIFGLLGVLMLLTPNLPVYVMFIPIPVKMKYAAPGILVLLWLISGGVSLVGLEGLPIGNTAHLGGFIFGIVYGLYLRNKYKNKTRRISRFFS